MSWTAFWKALYDRLLGALALRWPPSGTVVVQEVLPSGYKTPQPPPVLESRSLDDVEECLRGPIQALQDAFRREQGKELYITCTWRSTARQRQLYAQGRGTRGLIVTNIDGVSKRSRHNYYPSQAVDVAVDVDPGPGKVIVWDIKEYLPLGELCKRFGLVWGGSWTALKDYPHIELPAGWEKHPPTELSS